MLDRYATRRDFSHTPEPSPRQPAEADGPLGFVVHKHAARRLHYDFRIEVDGVLKSWAVPAGPSADPSVKRLAVMVEDHPLDYGSFEGAIPEGQYGAGQVIVWDRGNYWPEDPKDKDGRALTNRDRAEEVVRQGLAKGRLSLQLRGEKMKGSWTLVRMRIRGNKENWLLIKHRDEYASTANDLLDQGSSVLSGLSVDDLKGGSIPWRSESAEAPLQFPL